MTQIDSQQIRQMLADSEAPLNVEQMLAWVDEHPTFAVAAALLLSRGRHDIDEADRQHLQAVCALASADRTAIADLADLSGSDWAHFYPAEPVRQKTSTDNAIDTFIKIYGHSSPEEDALLEKLIFTPVASDYLGEAEAAEQKKTAPEPEKTSQAEPQPQPAATVPESDNRTDAHEHANGSNSPLLMESLASIFIKQRRYERALEIISNLSLKFPEKSAYFADQIRFLQKLIANQQCWTASQAQKQ